MGEVVGVVERDVCPEEEHAAVVGVEGVERLGEVGCVDAWIEDCAEHEVFDDCSDSCELGR